MKFSTKRPASLSSDDDSTRIPGGSMDHISEMADFRTREGGGMTLEMEVQMRNKSSSVYNLNIEDDVRKDKRPPAKTALSKLLSVLYCIVLTLCGFVFPLTEALRDRWHESVYHMIFQILIFTVAIAFLLYLQIRLIPLSKAKLKRDRQEEKEKARNSAQVRRTISGTSVNDPRNINGISESYEMQKGLPESRDNGADVKGIKRGTTGSTSTRLRVSISSVNLQDNRRSGGSFYSRGVEEGVLAGAQGSAVVAEALTQDPYQDMENFVDITKLGNAFSHHGSNLYLRLGALVFALCNIVFIGLEIENSVKIKLDKGCDGLKYWWTFIFRLAFLLTQSFLIFKNTSVEICMKQPLARFGFMHVVATNMCVWLHTVINEIKEEYHVEESALADHSNTTGQHSDELLTPDYSHTTVPAYNKECQYYAGILRDASPYLYPFVLEYSLIAIGMISFMISSIHEDSRSKVLLGLQNLFQVAKFERDEIDDDLSSVSSKSQSDFHGIRFDKSHRGMFLGALLLAGSCFSIFMFYYMTSYRDIIYFSADLCMHTFLLVATALGIYQLYQLSFIEKPASIDDVFIAISMSGSFLYEITLILPSAAYIGYCEDPSNDPRFDIEVIKLSSAIVAGVQTLTQTVLVVSGMRKYASKQSHLKNMPGRGTITFLIIGNVVVWISRTLQTKQVDYSTEFDYYGVIASLLMLDTNLPLLLFFRFHSSVCLAEVWSSAYSPIHEKLPQRATIKPNRNSDSELRTQNYVDSINQVTSTQINKHPYKIDAESVFIDSSGNWGMSRSGRRYQGSENIYTTDPKQPSLPRPSTWAGLPPRSETEDPLALQQPASEGPLYIQRGRSRPSSGEMLGSVYFPGIEVIEEVDEGAMKPPQTSDVLYHEGGPIRIKALEGSEENGQIISQIQSESRENSSHDISNVRTLVENMEMEEQHPEMYGSDDSGFSGNVQL